MILVVHRPKRKIRGSAACKLRKIVCSREGGFWGYSRTEKENLRAHSLETGGGFFALGGGLLITPEGYMNSYSLFRFRLMPAGTNI